MRQDTLSTEERPSIRIACVQFDPKWGQVERNMERVDELIASIPPGSLDVLLLPEMAMSGYVFSSAEEIETCLESAEDGPTRKWAEQTAARLQCAVLVGFPERAGDQRYNSLLAIDRCGQPLMPEPYRKSHLYETDYNWADEGPGFTSFSMNVRGRDICIVPAICMDINNKDFVAPWTDVELANHALSVDADLVLSANAWLAGEVITEDPSRPWAFASSRISYWLTRCEPLWDSGRALVICNRVGVERDVHFAGTSCGLIFSEGPTVLDYATSTEERVIAFDVPLRSASI